MWNFRELILFSNRKNVVKLAFELMKYHTVCLWCWYVVMGAGVNTKSITLLFWNVYCSWLWSKNRWQRLSAGLWGPNQQEVGDDKWLVISYSGTTIQNALPKWIDEGLKHHLWNLVQYFFFSSCKKRKFRSLVFAFCNLL